MKFEYDVIVIGGGHAGCEAAAAAAHLGAQTMLITMDMSKFASMSCNPAIGGVAKGQIVREIDALGGMTGIVTDRTAIQFRMLNRSKGAAMWSPRAQCDKTAFSAEWRHILENTENLSLWQDSVVELLTDGVEESCKVCGIRTALGVEFRARAVILTAGTFLGGLMHVGRNSTEGGRAGDAASHGLTEQLASLGFEVGRMKTGTPVRIDGRSVDFSQLERQDGDDNPSKFSFLPDTQPVDNQLPCWLVYTSLDVHDTLRTGFADSPLFNGTIQGIGPRYCPSIEDKLRTFAGKEMHQLFLEPEGRNTHEYYLNGFSSSLPWQVQIAALQKIKGFENVTVYRPGYAVEYDYFPPTQLHHTLETKLIGGLYFAGQVNGTTGYEEAAAQGLLAGINAVLALRGTEPLILGRDEAYIGVLIDDLVTKGVVPYVHKSCRVSHTSPTGQCRHPTDANSHKNWARHTRKSRTLCAKKIAPRIARKICSRREYHCARNFRLFKIGRISTPDTDTTPRRHNSAQRNHLLGHHQRTRQGGAQSTKRGMDRGDSDRRRDSNKIQRIHRTRTRDSRKTTPTRKYNHTRRLRLQRNAIPNNRSTTKTNQNTPQNTRPSITHPRRITRRHKRYANPIRQIEFAATNFSAFCKKRNQKLLYY